MSGSGNGNQRTLRKDLKTGVLLLHGLTGMPSEMRPVAKHLTQLGCIVECPLLPGHGGDHNALLDTNWKDWVAGAQRALDELSQKCDHIIVGGLSMGALLAAMCSIDSPKVSGLVMLSTTLRYDGKASSPLQILLPLIDILPVLGRMFWWTEEPPYGLKDVRLQKMITKQVEAASRGENNDFGLFRTYAGSLRQLHKLVGQIRKKGHLIKVPALVTHSLEDSMTTYKNALEVCELIGSQDKALVLLSGCDHVLTLDLRKRDVAIKIGSFVIEQSWRVEKSENATPATAQHTQANAQARSQPSLAI
jgi:carboxylesterase